MTYISFRETQIRAASVEMQAALDEILELLRTQRTRGDSWAAASKRLDEAVISWREALRNIRGAQSGYFIPTNTNRSHGAVR
jgi:hypothetical protein